MSLTVYFDTAFFVWLARADEQQADAVIEELRGLGVRPVLSHRIVQELMSSTRGPEANHRLHGRVTRLPPPLSLADDLSWDILLADVPLQELYSGRLRDIDDKEADAHSMALIADRKLNPEQQEAVEAAHGDLIAPLKNEQGEITPDRLSAFVERLVANLHPLMEKQGIDPAAILDAAQSDDLVASHGAILDAIGPERLAKLHDSNALLRSVTATDNRPLEVAMGQTKRRKKLANTYRDAGHMELFVEHRDVIDFLQVDGPQLQQINHKSPRHHLAALGLADRCFTAGSLDDVLDVLRGKVDLFRFGWIVTPTGSKLGSQ